eukprot:SM000001S04457  [mRNA]  locus=s1:278991:289139:+ [translate_table: standard]
MARARAFGLCKPASCWLAEAAQAEAACIGCPWPLSSSTRLSHPCASPCCLNQSPGKRSVWSQLTFSWVDPLLALGAERQLEFADLFELPETMQPQACGDRLWCLWAGRQRPDSGSLDLLWAVFDGYRYLFVAAGLIKLMNDALCFVGPLLLHEIIAYLDQGDHSSHTPPEDTRRFHYGLSCAIALGGAAAIRALLGTQYDYIIATIRLQMNAALMTAVYKKALCLSMADKSIFSSGEVQTFMSVDAERVTGLCMCLHDLWSLPFQIAVALLLLYFQVQYAFLAGLAFIVILIPLHIQTVVSPEVAIAAVYDWAVASLDDAVNQWLAARIAAACEAMMEAKDVRVRRMGELLAGIRTVKLYAWEPFFIKQTTCARQKELHSLATIKYLDAFCVYFWACTSILVSVLTFGLYALLGNPLRASTVFTSLALFNVLLAPLNCFPWVINGVVEASITSAPAAVSLRRLLRFLSCPELDPQWAYSACGHASHGPVTKGTSNSAKRVRGQVQEGHAWQEEVALSVAGARFTWSSQLAPCLKGVWLAVPQGAFVVVVGEVASGKTSLLAGLLGELKCLEGGAVLRGTVGYVSQVPWIQAATFRDNVLFGEEYDPERYAEVLQACALTFDLEQMPGSDLAELGERGLNLSGGQRSRLALARAIYQQRQVYFLDDPLSEVDVKVASHLLQNAICGPLMRSTTRIICTHHRQAVARADLLVVLKDGLVEYVGPPFTSYVKSFDLEGHSGAYADVTTADSQLAMDLQQPATGQGNASTFGLSTPSQIGAYGDNRVHGEGRSQACGLVGSKEEQGGSFVEEEEREIGSVRLVVYRQYLAAVGWAVVALVAASIFLMQATQNGADVWLSLWVDHTSPSSVSQPPGGFFYLVVMLDPLQRLSTWQEVYASLALANTVFTLSRSFSFAYGGLRAAKGLHQELLSSVLAAPVDFFDRTPLGRILNRFSSDQNTIDDSLPFIVNILVTIVFEMGGVLVVVCYTQRFYRETSRELRRLHSLSLSPIYATFSEALEGAPLIRAFDKQATFTAAHAKRVSRNQQTSFSETVASLWLSVRLQLMAAFLVTTIALFAVVKHHWSPTFLPQCTAAMTGLGLSYAMPIVELLNAILTTFTETEKDLVSVERVQQYMTISKEEEGKLGETLPLKLISWPTAGSVTFQNASLVYRPGLLPALDSLTFSIAAREHVGIVGRTGAGKSSVLAALFRLYKLAAGRILIDNVDIASIPLRQLRSRIGVVPQSPFLFSGSVRENLDPAGAYADHHIWEALKKCHLAASISSLEMQVAESGSNFSRGQQQLLCLARTILQRQQVLCLDECTASIDPVTTQKIQETVARECKSTTVIVIVHTPATIVTLPRVIVMDRGSVVEDGQPLELLKDMRSHLSMLINAERQSVSSVT